MSKTNRANRANNDVRPFEGAGATILFIDNGGERKRLIFAMRNPDYVKNEKHLDECEYPGGKVDESDYTSTSSDQEAALFAAKREWDEEVFSLLETLPQGDQWRKRGNQLFEDFVTDSRDRDYADVQGGKSTIRLFMPEIDLELKVNDGRDMLLSILELADKSLEENYKKDKTIPPLRGIVSVDLKDIVQCLKDISNDVVELERTLKGGKLMKAIGPHCANHKIKFTRLSTRETVERAIRKFNFFTLRALFQKRGF